jgi:hypothetical protein
MVGFAKLHVEAALKAVCENGKAETDWQYDEKSGGELELPTGGIDNNSVYEAYPLDNIK